jgi:hypothetical protein
LAAPDQLLGCGAKLVDDFGQLVAAGIGVALDLAEDAFGFAGDALAQISAGQPEKTRTMSSMMLASFSLEALASLRSWANWPS